LLLAMLVWFVIKFALYRGFTGGRYQVLEHQPVLVLRTPDDARVFRLDPSNIDVVVQAKKELKADDIEAYVDLTHMPDVNTALKQVMVRAADTTKIIRTEPAFIMVERAAPLDSPLGNLPRKP
jgi:hypothetical protein